MSGSATVCGSARGSVRHCGQKCATVLLFGSVRQCAAVRVAICGSVHGSVCLFLFNYVCSSYFYEHSLTLLFVFITSHATLNTVVN
jgi:hypothetical protein